MNINFHDENYKECVFCLGNNRVMQFCITPPPKIGLRSKKSFSEVMEEKLLGTWVDKSGNCMDNVTKRKDTETKFIYNTKNVGLFLLKHCSTLF